MNRRDVEVVLRRSDEADLWQRRLANNWMAGFAAAEAARADDYEKGFAAGVLAVKRAQQDVHRLTGDESARWQLRGEPRSREYFGDPHPDDYQGGPLLRGAA